MPSFWSDLARNVRRASLAILLYATIRVGLDLLMEDGFALALLSLTLLFIFDYFLYRAALSDVGPPLFRKTTRPDGEAKPIKAFGRYMLVAFLFAILVGGPALLFGIAIAFSGHQQVLSRFAPEHVMLWLMLWCMLSAFGTLFPAAADGRPFSPRNALQVAKRTWRSVGFQLLLLPGLGGWLLILLWRQADVALDALSLPQPMYFGSETILTAVHSVTHVLTVVILTRAYRLGWPQPVLPQPDA